MGTFLVILIAVLSVLTVVATIFGVVQGVEWLFMKYKGRRERLRGGGRVVGRAALPIREAGDASRFVRDVEGADGMVLAPNQRFTKVWEIQNVGSLVWEGRYLQRLGAPEGPGLIRSAARVPLPTTRPGETVQVRVEMEAPSTEGTTIARFKMVDKDGSLCFPDRYPEGLFVTVNVVEGIALPEKSAPAD
jgi:hypothetical protein